MTAAINYPVYKTQYEFTANRRLFKAIVDTLADASGQISDDIKRAMSEGVFFRSVLSCDIPFGYNGVICRDSKGGLHSPNVVAIETIPSQRRLGYFDRRMIFFRVCGRIPRGKSAESYVTLHSENGFSFDSTPEPLGVPDVVAHQERIIYAKDRRIAELEERLASACGMKQH